MAQDPNRTNTRPMIDLQRPDAGFYGLVRASYGSYLRTVHFLVTFGFQCLIELRWSQQNVL